MSASILTAEMRTPAVKQLLEMLPGIAESISVATQRHLTTEDGENVTVVHKTVEPFEQQVDRFGPAEMKWLETNLQLAISLGIKYGCGGRLTPLELDVVFARWMFDEDEKESQQKVASALGAAYGEYLADELGFQWVTITDHHGKDRAVQHDSRSVTAFPESSILKRIDRREPDCFRALHAGIVDIMRRHCEQDSA